MNTSPALQAHFEAVVLVRRQNRRCTSDGVETAHSTTAAETLRFLGCATRLGLTRKDANRLKRRLDKLAGLYVSGDLTADQTARRVRRAAGRASR